MLSTRIGAASTARMCRRVGGRRIPATAHYAVGNGSRLQYATSSKPAQASAALAQQTHSNEPPPFAAPPPRKSAVTPLNHTLPTRIPLTFLPTPLPAGESSGVNTHFYPDSAIQHTFSVMDALLRDGYDVPRAVRIFDSLRKSPDAKDTLDVELFNSFFGAYLGEALKNNDRAKWLTTLWSLFYELAAPNTKRMVRPNRESFAIALLAMVKFSPTSPTPVPDSTAPDPERFLGILLDHRVLLSDLMSSPLLQFDLVDCAQTLRIAALELGRPDIVLELGKMTSPKRTDDLDTVPEVMPVNGIKTLRMNLKRLLSGRMSNPDAKEVDEADLTVPYNLQAMREYLKLVKSGRESLPDDATARQRIMEESAYQIAQERWKHDFEELQGRGILSVKRTQLKQWMWTWYLLLKERLDNEIPTLMEQELEKKDYVRATAASKYGVRVDDVIGPYLRLLSTEKLAALTIMEVMRYPGGVETGVRTTRAVVTLGRAVESEYDAEISRIRRSMYDPNPVTTTSEGGLAELAERRAAAREVTDDMDRRPEWTQPIRAKLGGFLLDALMDVASVTRTGTRQSTGEEVTEEQPAFIHHYEFLHGRKIGVIKFNEALTYQLSTEPVRESLHPRQLPMLVPPRPWLEPDKGGYMYSKTPAMRYKDSVEQVAFLRSASKAGHLETLYAGLDVLGSTPWAINRAVFDVVLQVWNSGEQFAKIPPAGLEIPDPPKPEDYDVNPAAKSDFLRAMQDVVQRRHENHSMRCDVNYKMEIARAFLSERFYLPHNVDFRGRAYPVPPNLNHLGDDLCRGLMTFADKKMLGERGLRWLKIHVANKFGYDKASFEERVNFAMEHLDDVYDSATKPLEGRRWWLQADDPWQCLAACVELHSALESGNPFEFESSLPVHQDGTCNGLQHYAALGGDGQGARQVNLDVTDRPADVYTYVADMVEARLEEAAKKGDELAIYLRGRIARKVVKQTVMTTVYGVTFIGARQQIRKQLENIPNFVQSEEHGYRLAVYVAKITLQCIGDLFKGAKSIQKWLTSTAGLIAKSIPPDRIEALLNAHEQAGKDDKAANTKRKGSKRTKDTKVAAPSFKASLSTITKEQMTSMIWTTPIGLPVVQPYRKQSKKQVLTKLQTVFISDPNLPMGVNAMRQASAFPPNFIHSLDATHMMLTALGCRSKQLTFASVHDSYWTHAASIDEMSGIIRDTFVVLHSTDILGNLQTEIKDRYRGYKVPITALRTSAQSAAADKDATPGGSPASRVRNVARLTAEQMEGVSASEELDLVINDESSEEDDVDMDGSARPKKARDKKETGADLIKTRFVNLADVLPPIPKKGEFDINKIRGSLYFFS